MQEQTNYKANRGASQAVASYGNPGKRASLKGAKIRARGEVKYKNVCAICYTEKRLIRIRRASGDYYLCTRHALGVI